MPTWACRATRLRRELADALGLEDNKLGVYVSQRRAWRPGREGWRARAAAKPSPPADGAELQKGGDIVTAIDDQPVRRFEDLVSFLVTKAAPGQTVTLTVLRDGAEQQVSVELGERPAQPVASERTRQARPDQRPRCHLPSPRTPPRKRGMTGDITEKVATPDQA